MICGREFLMILEGFEKQQKQIWDDAADYGLANPSKKAKGSIRYALAELMKIYKCKINVWGPAYKQSKQFTMFIPIEKDGAGYNGITVSLTWEPIMKRGVHEYIHIYTANAHSTAPVDLHFTTIPYTKEG